MIGWDCLNRGNWSGDSAPPSERLAEGLTGGAHGAARYLLSPVEHPGAPAGSASP
ncbi:MAG: hypothetical protein GY859_39700 [Desulfobacterales bacterium]|nr:hypothetical protein [Desulfobacterales bacterium]